MRITFAFSSRADPYWGNPPTHVPTHVYTRQGTISGTCDASFWSPANQSVHFPVLGHGLRHGAPCPGSSRIRASRPSDTKRIQPISAERQPPHPTSPHPTPPHITSPHWASPHAAKHNEAFGGRRHYLTSPTISAERLPPRVYHLISHHPTPHRLAALDMGRSPVRAHGGGDKCKRSASALVSATVGRRSQAPIAAIAGHARYRPMS